MADRVSVSITIGGKLPADRLPELYKLADFYGLSTEWGGEPLESVTSGEPLRLHAHEVQNGNIEDIEDFCCTNDLPFRTWSGGSPGSFSPEVRVWPGHGPGPGQVIAEFAIIGNAIAHNCLPVHDRSAGSRSDNHWPDNSGSVSHRCVATGRDS